MISRSLQLRFIRKFIFSNFLLSCFSLLFYNHIAAKQQNLYNSVLPSLPASQIDNSFAPLINPVLSDLFPNPSLSYMVQNIDYKDYNHFLLADYAGLIFSYSWINNFQHHNNTSIHAKVFTIGKGFFFNDVIGFGANYSFSISNNNAFDKYKSLTMGLLFRPANFVSLGYVARDINNPKVYNEKTARSDIYSLSIKPHKNITLSVDTIKYEGKKINKSDILFSTSFRFKYDISAYASINKDKDFTFGLSAPFGINAGESASIILDSYASKISDISAYAIGTTIASAKSKSPLLESKRFLKIRLDKAISETKTGNLFGDGELIFYDLLKAIAAAGSDSSISGIILQIDNADLGFAQIQELRAQIRQFRKKNKKIYAVLNAQGNKEYYLASACDKIYFTPANLFAITGLKAEIFFFKGGLDKIGIKFESVSKGQYKSYSEQFTREKMSREFRENMTALISDLNDQYIGDMINDRQNSQLSAEKINDLFAKGFLTPHEALQAGFIDEIEYPIDAERKITENSGLLEFAVSLKDYINEKERNNYWGPKPEIAVIYISGSIIHGDSKDYGFVPARTIGDATYYKALTDAFKDFNIKAIVVRVDSGGGSSLASELMRNYLIRLKHKYKKPVVFSFGNSAASGGYYIACTGDHIFCNSGSVTGSIGVVFWKPSLKELYGKLGINKETIKMSKFADIFSEAKDMSPEERKIIEQGVDYTYKNFTEKVSEARGIPKERIDEVAEGRVFTGSQAKNNGLVDSVGSLLDAVESAKKLANMEDDYTVRHLPETQMPLMQLLGLKSDNQLLTGNSFPDSTALFQLFDAVEFKDEYILLYFPYRIIIK